MGAVSYRILSGRTLLLDSALSLAALQLVDDGALPVHVVGDVVAVEWANVLELTDDASEWIGAISSSVAQMWKGKAAAAAPATARTRVTFRIRPGSF